MQIQNQIGKYESKGPYRQSLIGRKVCPPQARCEQIIIVNSSDQVLGSCPLYGANMSLGPQAPHKSKSLPSRALTVIDF